MMLFVDQAVALLIRCCLALTLCFMERLAGLKRLTLLNLMWNKKTKQKKTVALLPLLLTTASMNSKNKNYPWLSPPLTSQILRDRVF